MRELESEKRLNDIKHSIETATGESYNDLTEAVNGSIDKAKEAEDWKNHFSNVFCARNSNMGAIFKGYTGTKAPKFDVSQYKTIEGMYCEAANLESIDFYLNYNGNSIYQLCQNTPKLKFIKGVKTSNTTFISNAFYGCGVEEIEVPFDFSKVTTANNPFYGCYNLIKILFISETIPVSLSFAYSPLLSNESKQSIFDGLAIVTTAQTVTFHKDVKLLQSQIDSANAKGWTVAGGTVVSEEEYYG